MVGTKFKYSTIAVEGERMMMIMTSKPKIISVNELAFGKEDSRATPRMSLQRGRDGGLLMCVYMFVVSPWTHALYIRRAG